ncbi:oxidized low-density lipoprotein receptor 1-like [Terrapene carolina triunguis]|uniref:oxidized low-density lipoprotein receptor 1-like n=1 Tax=Terrapene triunguis TaxID=2587831 RepID=UPI000E77A638|nr:oxidized low-density lipoprotein receptor 1-like [Terrapene carolina triunguis]
MSEQDVTYSELKFHSPNEQQSRQRAEKAKNEDSSSLPPHLQLILVILGIFCLVLLVTIGVLGAKVLQNENPNKQHELLENLTQLQNSLEICHQQKDDLQAKNTNLTNIVNIKVLQNKTLNKQCEIVDNITQLQKTLENCHQQRDDLQAKNTNLTNIVNMKGDKCRPCPESWIQHGEKCYHFSKEMKTWHKSKEYCSSWGSLLLKIENKEELGFIKSQASFHWIGLSRTAIGHGWVWQDGTAHSTDLFPVKIQEPGEKCALFKAGEAFSHNCTGQYRYICEKRATQKKATERAQGRFQYPRQS